MSKIKAKLIWKKFEDNHRCEVGKYELMVFRERENQFACAIYSNHTGSRKFAKENYAIQQLSFKTLEEAQAECEKQIKEIIKKDVHDYAMALVLSQYWGLGSRTGDLVKKDDIGEYEILFIKKTEMNFVE